MPNHCIGERKKDTSCRFSLIPLVGFWKNLGVGIRKSSPCPSVKDTERALPNYHRLHCSNFPDLTRSDNTPASYAICFGLSTSSVLSFYSLCKATKFFRNKKEYSPQYITDCISIVESSLRCGAKLRHGFATSLQRLVFFNNKTEI